MAESEEIDEVKGLTPAVSSLLLNIEVDLMISVDSKNFYTSLSTHRNSIDQSLRAEVNCIIFEFEIHSISRMFWMAGQQNRVDPLSKTESPLSVANYSSGNSIRIDFVRTSLSGKNSSKRSWNASLNASIAFANVVCHTFFVCLTTQLFVLWWVAWSHSIPIRTDKDYCSVVLLSPLLQFSTVLYRASQVFLIECN